MSQINAFLELTLWIKKDFLIGILSHEGFFVFEDFHSTFSWSTEVNHNREISFFGDINLINLDNFSRILKNAWKLIIEGQYDGINKRNKDRVRNWRLLCLVIDDFYDIGLTHKWLYDNIDTIGHKINFYVLYFLYRIGLLTNFTRHFGPAF